MLPFYKTKKSVANAADKITAEAGELDEDEEAQAASVFGAPNTARWESRVIT